LAFIVRIYHDARCCECQTLHAVCTVLSFLLHATSLQQQEEEASSLVTTIDTQILTYDRNFSLMVSCLTVYGYNVFENVWNLCGHLIEKIQ